VRDSDVPDSVLLAVTKGHLIQHEILTRARLPLRERCGNAGEEAGGGGSWTSAGTRCQQTEA